MKVRPILFSGEMIRALLDGRKTQTRRIVKPQPAHSCRYTMNGNGTAALHHAEKSESGYFFPVPVKPTSGDHRLPCKYGHKGDLLYVRETWRVHEHYNGMNAHMIWVAMGGDTIGCVDFLATPRDEEFWGRGRPSIHMPRWASRLTLELSDVRVERLQDISDADAMAEGVTKVKDACYVIRGFDYDKVGLCHSHATTPFMKLWDSLNEERGYGWEANPWVWVLEFKVHKMNIDRAIIEIKK